MSRVTDEQLFRDASEATDLPAELERIAARCDRVDDRWLHAMVFTDGDVCLRISKGSVELYLRWDDGELREVERRPPNGTLPPQVAGPVRALAAVQTADGIAPVWAEETPFDE